MEQGRRKHPFGEIVRLVREGPAAQVHRFCSGIVDLDPVLFLPINIIKPLVVDRHKLVDPDEFLGPEPG